MSETVHRIVANLADQERVYRRLLDLSHAQVTALKAQDVQTVHAVLQEIELTMLDRSRIEQERSRTLQSLAAEWGVEVEEITASEIAERCDAALAHAIRASSESLRVLIAELDVAVDRSRALLEQELQLIDHLVRGLTGNGNMPTYAKNGAQPEAPRRKLLDMQV